MRGRVHIKYPYIYLCNCNSYTCQKGKEFGFPWSVRWRKILLCFKGGVLNYALECRLDGVQNHSRSRPYLCTRAFSDGISWPSPLLHGREDFWVIIHFCCWVGILRVCFQVDNVLQHFYLHQAIFCLSPVLLRCWRNTVSRSPSRSWGKVKTAKRKLTSWWSDSPVTQDASMTHTHTHTHTHTLCHHNISHSASVHLSHCLLFAQKPSCEWDRMERFTSRSPGHAAECLYLSRARNLPSGTTHII